MNRTLAVRMDACCQKLLLVLVYVRVSTELWESDALQMTDVLHKVRWKSLENHEN